MKQVLMLRGINLGPKRRVPMAELRELFTSAGFADVKSYVRSGNIVLDSALGAAELEAHGASMISERFGFAVPVIARSGAELTQVVKHDPWGQVAEDPKRYQVSFLSEPLNPEAIKRLDELAGGSEAVTVRGREVYCWHPHGVARSKLWNALGGKALGVTATTRNWTTVLALLALTDA